MLEDGGVSDEAVVAAAVVLLVTGTIVRMVGTLDADLVAGTDALAERTFTKLVGLEGDTYMCTVVVEVVEDESVSTSAAFM